MNLQSLLHIGYLISLGHLLVFGLSFLQSGIRPKGLIRLSKAVSLIGLVIALLLGVLVYQEGALHSSLIGFKGLGFSLRLDAVSLVMSGMISLLSYVIIRFSVNYLDGDQRQGVFFGRLSATLAAVQVLVLSGNLVLLFIGWVGMSVALHSLLTFYKERPGAQLAARKKAILARLGDVALFSSFTVLYFAFNTGELSDIFINLQRFISAGQTLKELELAALLLVLGAFLKSAQFPVHGWLIEVMETPTPVSSLLHAGLLNAGPFLIIRMAYLMEATQMASVALVCVGGLSALFGSLVYLTQPSIKTALGYSSIAHMGFSLMTSGMGVYAAAMLHLVAHSFYKAHSFLSTGSIIDQIRANRFQSSNRLLNPIRMALGLLTSIGVFLGIAQVFNVDFSNQPGLLAIGFIMVMGMSNMLVAAFDTDFSSGNLLKLIGLAVLTTLSFFTLESAMHSLVHSVIPEKSMLTGLQAILMIFVLVAALAIIVLQITFPLYRNSSVFQLWAVHLKNGLYINALFDRMVGALHIPREESIDEIRIPGNIFLDEEEFKLDGKARLDTERI